MLRVKDITHTQQLLPENVTNNALLEGIYLDQTNYEPQADMTGISPNGLSLSAVVGWWVNTAVSGCLQVCSTV